MFSDSSGKKGKKKIIKKKNEGRKDVGASIKNTI